MSKKTTHKKNQTQNKHRLGASQKTAATKVVRESKKKITIHPRLEKWKLIETIGEKQKDLVKLKDSRDWDFSHLRIGIESLLQKYNDGSTIFLFGSQPQPYDEDGEGNSSQKNSL